MTVSIWTNVKSIQLYAIASSTTYGGAFEKYVRINTN